MKKLIVICGPMFAGKTTELLRLLSRSKRSGRNVIVMKPIIDDRYSISEIVTHDGIKVPCVNNLDPLNTKYKNVDFFVDEVQFIEPDQIDKLVQLFLSGNNITVSGLDLDYCRNPFNNVSKLLSLATEVIKLKSICSMCGEEAQFTYLKNKENIDNTDSNVVLIGGEDLYEARCINCYPKGEQNA